MSYVNFRGQGTFSFLYTIDEIFPEEYRNLVELNKKFSGENVNFRETENTNVSEEVSLKETDPPNNHCVRERTVNRRSGS